MADPRKAQKYATERTRAAEAVEPWLRGLGRVERVAFLRVDALAAGTAAGQRQLVGGDGRRDRQAGGGPRWQQRRRRRPLVPRRDVRRHFDQKWRGGGADGTGGGTGAGTGAATGAGTAAHRHTWSKTSTAAIPKLILFPASSPKLGGNVCDRDDVEMSAQDVESNSYQMGVPSIGKPFSDPPRKPESLAPFAENLL